MECLNIEERLSEYLERSLAPEEMSLVAQHVHECDRCSALLEEMRSVLLACKAFPRIEPDLELVERILLRTSGRPRTRSFRELLQQYFLRPMLTPRFAVGTAIVALFLILSANLLLPHAASFAAVLSPREWVRQMDRGVQAIYSEGLKAYDKKNEFQAWFTFNKNTILNKLGFFMEQLDVPVQTKEKSQEQNQQHDKKGAGEKSSSMGPVRPGLAFSLL
jgi:hypothetical protein